MPVCVASNPKHQATIAQLGEGQTEDPKVPGSIPGLGILPEFFQCVALPKAISKKRNCVSWDAQIREQHDPYFFDFATKAAPHKTS